RTAAVGGGPVATGRSATGAGRSATRGAASRHALLRQLATIEGVYVPSMYEVRYDGPRLVEVSPRYPDVPPRVQKRTIADLGAWPYPKRQLVPMTEVVHDRLNVEIFRGCTRGCRFCQAGMVTRPVRERPAEQVSRLVTEGLRRTGYDEVSLTSLSSADFSGIADTVGAIVGDPMCTGQGPISVSLPSLRVDAFTVGIATELQKARRTGLTFAPEAGTWRLRQVINKLISEEDLYGAVDGAFSQGWRRVKLYFLIGLPTETDADTLGIAELARNCVAVGRRHTKSASVTASVGGFVPKPQTPFQWFGQVGAAELQRRVNLLRDATKADRGVQLKWHDPKATLAEGIASRGDRRIGAVIEDVWRAGGTFQEWSEHFDLSLWESAMARHGLSVEWYVERHRDESEVLPWDHISAGLHRDFLWQDWRDALAEHGLPDCRWTPCYDCGACTGYGIEHVVASPVPPAGGSQGTGQDLSAGGSTPVVLLRSRPPRPAPRLNAALLPIGVASP
ncbi:MAG: TIGR03960 family B12-binding radical SAM protein, partial [Acidimicrobiales bacterium]